jgi:hypothetical protein
MRQNKAITEKKYSAFVLECYNAKTFDAISLSKKHKVDRSLITTLSNLELVVNVQKGVYNWIGLYPTNGDITGIIDLHRNRMMEYRKSREKKQGLIKLRAASSNEGISNHGEKSLECELIMTEKKAVDFLKSIGGYEIYKVERKQL